MLDTGRRKWGAVKGCRLVRDLAIRRLGHKELHSWFRAAGSIPVNEPWSPGYYLAAVKVERVEQQAKM